MTESATMVDSDLSGLAVINMSLQKVQNKFVISIY
jgi:hypothetical protein